MLTSLSRATPAVRAVARAARGNAVQVRGFIVPTVSRRADFVQELYLKELKAYKAPPVKDSDATGHVQTFSVPKTPKSPEEANLAESLKEYESMAVETEAQEQVAAAGAVESDLDNWLEEEDDDDHGKGH